MNIAQIIIYADDTQSNIKELKFQTQKIINDVEKNIKKRVVSKLNNDKTQIFTFSTTN